MSAGARSSLLQQMAGGPGHQCHGHRPAMEQIASRPAPSFPSFHQHQHQTWTNRLLPPYPAVRLPPVLGQNSFDSATSSCKSTPLPPLSHYPKPTGPRHPTSRDGLLPVLARELFQFSTPPASGVTPSLELPLNPTTPARAPSFGSPAAWGLRSLKPSPTGYRPTTAGPLTRVSMAGTVQLCRGP